MASLRSGCLFTGTQGQSWYRRTALPGRTVEAASRNLMSSVKNFFMLGTSCDVFVSKLDFVLCGICDTKTLDGQVQNQLSFFQVAFSRNFTFSQIQNIALARETWLIGAYSARGRCVRFRLSTCHCGSKVGDDFHPLSPS